MSTLVRQSPAACARRGACNTTMPMKRAVLRARGPITGAYRYPSARRSCILAACLALCATQVEFLAVALVKISLLTLFACSWLPAVASAELNPPLVPAQDHVVAAFLAQADERELDHLRWD